MKLFFRRHPYLLSLVTVTFALLACLALDAWLADQVSYALFFVAITISAMYGSIRASIVATILGGFAVYYFAIPPRHHWGFQTPAFFVGFVQYLLAAATIIWLSKSRSNAWQQTEHNLLRLHESKEQLRIALGAAGMGTWYWNLVTDIVTCDSRCRELFGMAD